MNETKTFTRREALRLSAGSLLALGLWPGVLRAEEKDSAGEIRFVVVNDTHYMSDECGPYLERVVRQMKSHDGVEFCLLAGDLCEHGKRDELASVRDIFKGLGVPTYVVIGNHDYLTQEDRSAYEELFPDRINYRFDFKGWQFVALDSSEGQRYTNTKVQEPTLRWLDDHLPKLNKKLPIIVFTHFPMGPYTPARPTNADDVLERFKPYNLRAVFCGHFHGFTERKVGESVLTTNRCCALKRNNHDGTKEKGYFLCHAKAGTITRTFVEVKPA